MTPEFRLAAACAAWPPSDERDEAIRRAAANVTDWPLFRRVVARQRIPGLVHVGLVRARAAVPVNVASALANEARALARSNLSMTAESFRLKELFGEQGIRLAFLKGQTLAQLGYGGIAFRHSKDIDILIPDDRIGSAVRLLETAGYRRVMPSVALDDRKAAIWMRTFKNFEFVNDTRRMMVELHWRLSDNRYIVSRFPQMPPLRDVTISDAFALPTLAEDDLFLYLCVHGASHCWFRLKWIADIAALTAVLSDDRLEGLLATARARNIARPFAQAMFLSQTLFGSRLPAGLIDDRALHRTGHRLAAVARISITRGGGAIEPREVFLAHPWNKLSEYLLGGWRNALAQTRCSLVSEKDWLLLPLPPHLSFLYPLIRFPLWIWRSFRGSGRKKALRLPQPLH